MFANLALASYIKFKDSQPTAIAVTVVLGIGALYFFLSHGRWLRYVSGSTSDIQNHLKVRESLRPATPLSLRRNDSCPERRRSAFLPVSRAVAALCQRQHHRYPQAFEGMACLLNAGPWIV